MILHCNDSPETLELPEQISLAYLQQALTLDEAMQLAVVIRDAQPGFNPLPESLHDAASRYNLFHWEVASSSRPH